MRVRKPVWTEGLFITQHHLQQLDRYHESLLGSRLHALAPYDWGIESLEIDERALAVGQFRVTRLVGVLPEGTYVEAGAHMDDVVAPRTIATNALPPSMATLDVYVGLANEADNAANVELEGRAASPARFVREQVLVPDYNTGASEHPFQWARRNLRVVLGDEPRDAFVGIRVAQLVRAGTGEIVLRHDFVAPVLKVSASSYLTNGFRRLLDVLTSKQRSLAENRRQRTKGAVEFQASDAAKFWLLHTINTHIPALAHIVGHGTTHPEDAYLALAALIGQLCTFAVDGDPSAIPAFNFLDLGSCFAPMFQRAQYLLDVVVAEKYVQIPLTKRPDGMYLGQFEDRTVLQYEFFVIATGAGVQEELLRDRIPRLSKIASWTQIQAILNSAVNGAKLELEYRPPGALPLKQGGVYFRLKKTPDFWNDIAGTGSIALYQPLEPDAVDLQLIAIDPQNLK